jgi:S-adenosylmethionine:tRNA ribosyltransferase-isomerase
LLFLGAASAEVLAVEGEGFLQLRFSGIDDLASYCEAHGELPLPSYLGRAPHPADERRYQTIFATDAALGAVAAPTAGLHFSEQIVKELQARGVQLAALTLLVGPGTFLPVRAAQIEDHRMEAERFEIPLAVAEAVARTRRSGGRVIAVGTTSARALEAASEGDGVRAGSGMTDLFIRPGYRFRALDGLLTNFHLPGSTLLMLVSALAGRERVLAAYAHAVAQRYRFFSYGDCCLFL